MWRFAEWWGEFGTTDLFVPHPADAVNEHPGRPLYPISLKPVPDDAPNLESAKERIEVMEARWMAISSDYLFRSEKAACVDAIANLAPTILCYVDPDANTAVEFASLPVDRIKSSSMSAMNAAMVPIPTQAVSRTASLPVTPLLASTTGDPLRP